MTELHPNHSELVEKLATQREEELKKIGDLEPYVMAPVPNSMFTGGPRWPNGNQSWRFVELPDGYKLIISDGLANAFDDPADKWKPTNGVGGELYIIVKDDDLTFENLHKSIWFRMLVRASHIVADEAWNNGYYLPAYLEKYTYLSLGLDNSLVPEGFQPDDHYDFGIILGVPDTQIPDSLTITEKLNGETYELKTKFVQIIPLKPEELRYILDRGSDGRRSVGRRLAELSREELTNIKRKPVL